MRTPALYVSEKLFVSTPRGASEKSFLFIFFLLSCVGTFILKIFTRNEESEVENTSFYCYAADGSLCELALAERDDFSCCLWGELCEFVCSAVNCIEMGTF